MQTRTEQGGVIMVLERGEELVSTITTYATEYGIAAGVFWGIGAVERVEIGYYDLATKSYRFKKDDGIFEVASMQGNIALVDGAPFVHAHAVLSRCDETYSCIGAHIKEAYVAVTLEVLCRVFETPLTRALNDEIGLKLLQL